MALKKPQTADDLTPPFAVVGEPGWADRLRTWLADFDFRFAVPSTEAEVAAAETRLGVRLPADWRAFLLAFGPLDLDGLRLSSPAAITHMDGVWFRSHLSEPERALLPQLLQVGECGSDNFVAFSTRDGWVCVCSHDPGGLWDWCPSFSDFLRVQLVRLWSGYYGWPDESVQELSDGLASQWLAAWDQQRHAERPGSAAPAAPESLGSEKAYMRPGSAAADG